MRRQGHPRGSAGDCQGEGRERDAAGFMRGTLLVEADLKRFQSANEPHTSCARAFMRMFKVEPEEAHKCFLEARKMALKKEPSLTP